METVEELTAELEKFKTKLMWLRSLGGHPKWRSASSEEKKLRHDQERYLSEYVRTLNRLIALVANQ